MKRLFTTILVCMGVFVFTTNILYADLRFATMHSSHAGADDGEFCPMQGGSGCPHHKMRCHDMPTPGMKDHDMKGTDHTARAGCGVKTQDPFFKCNCTHYYQFSDGYTTIAAHQAAELRQDPFWKNIFTGPCGFEDTAPVRLYTPPRLLSA